MNEIDNIIVKYDLKDLFEENVFSDPNNVSEEINHNYVTIGFNPDDAKYYSVEQIKEIMTDIMESKHRYLVKNNLPEMIFYIWYDEQSMNLSYCIVSKTIDYALPFKCKLNIVQDMSVVIKNCVNGLLEGYISVEDFIPMSDDELEENNNDYCLDVYAKIIGRKIENH